MAQSNPPAGWYRDPTGVGDGRYWDGTMWTNSISRANQTIDVPIDPQQASLPPVPGSELRTPTATATPPTVTVNAPSRSPIGAIVGGIVAIAAVVLVIVLLTNNDDSSNDESPPATNAPSTEAPATEAPAEEG